MDRFINKMDMMEFSNLDDCLQLLFDEGLLRTTMLCPECNAVLHPFKRRDRTYPEFCCRTGHKKVTRSVCTGTWFEKAKLPPFQILLLAHCFAHKFSYTVSSFECSRDDKYLSSRSVADWFSFCREVCVLSLDSKYTERGKIGGPNHVVQIDECSIGQRRFHRGRIMEGNWILGMIDVETNEVRMEICPKDRRDGRTLFSLIEQHVELTSTIHTDAWGGYYGPLSDGFAAHLSVNHSQNFVDPVTDCNTKNMESHWRTLRRRLSRGGIRRDSMDNHICEFLWHQDCKSRSADPFQELIEDIRRIYPVD